VMSVLVTAAKTVLRMEDSSTNHTAPANVSPSLVRFFREHRAELDSLDATLVRGTPEGSRERTGQ
jgi:hypothetical protein